MDLKEFYIRVNGNYDDVMSRLMKEDRVKKYLGKFLDSAEYGKMIEAYENKDWPDLFLQSHSLKGMAANLSLTALFNAASNVCEEVRDKEPGGDIAALIDKIKSEYSLVTDAIKETV